MAGPKFKPAHALPPAFIALVVATVFAIYAGLHLCPLLQFHVPQRLRSVAAEERGTLQAWIFTVLTGLVVVCYGRCVLAGPGDVPRLSVRPLKDVESPWETMELKMSGEPRFCKWCNAHKPDRTHHCRVCGTCVLKMDHHCPWIMSCVGFRNHKYFVLLIAYSAFDCAFVASTMSESVRTSVVEETPSANRFCLVLGMTLATVMGLLCTVLGAFHAHLMIRGMTTIEFCEQSVAGRPTSKARSYDCGRFANVSAVLGPQPLLWLLPLCPPEGDGVSWPSRSYPQPSPRPGRQNPDPEWTATATRRAPPGSE